MRRLGELPLITQAGASRQHHHGADVLGVLIAHATGADLEAVLGERVLRPLEMGDTAFSVPPEKLGRFCPQPAPAGDGGFAVVDPADGVWSAPPAFPSGGGGLVSTVDDLPGSARMLRDGGPETDVTSVLLTQVLWTGPAGPQMLQEFRGAAHS